MLQREWDSEPFSDDLISSSFDGAESFNKALGSNILLKRGQTQPPYQAQIKKSRNSLRFVSDWEAAYLGTTRRQRRIQGGCG
ncbi:MAG: hypothetical protein KVP17_000100 [Porospora cf. gigantea B]|uniref:uncharacterized protein n=1 Tax=Porospora cf. gigantea B TaxID=2853592 RepID=UPI003571AC14|nr:MAG: hypothetical protein KVP17_000100 [Porospora cf. gigantea B]